jgi:hypothetical protein
MRPDRKDLPAAPGLHDAWRQHSLASTQIRMTSLPGRLTEALRLVERLAR